MVKMIKSNEPDMLENEINMFISNSDITVKNIHYSTQVTGQEICKYAAPIKIYNTITHYALIEYEKGKVDKVYG